MAQINLRDYLQGLEEMIDGGRAEEALAHCRHILQRYPKNVGTYRVMGKGYLELKRHSEASDIFQRVLSSVPDDFVSHIGMSIIREDEGNQDASIWHMERAFESQPSNRAVQDELRRLYGKREGYEPPKVRLTRGALARMYSHGDLYNQAVSELRSALAEDAQRPDLQALLAEMYYRMDRQADAIETCSKLIEKLPYCLLPNRIMADVLRASHKEVEAQPYVDRVEELDPYAAQVDVTTPVEEVPADTVMLEQMAEETRSAEVVPPRAWTSSLKLPDQQGYQKEELPDWLSLGSLEEKSESQPVVDETPQTEPKLTELEKPSSETSSAEEEIPGTPLPFTSISRSTALQADNIPDWLRELHPATGTLSFEPEENLPPVTQEPEQTKSQPESEAPPAWLDELRQPEEEKPAAVSPFDESPPPARSREVEKPAMSQEDQENLSWLEGLAAKQGAAEEELLTKPEERQDTEPDWLAKEMAPSPKRMSDTLAWLDELNKEDEEEAKKKTSASLRSEIEKPEEHIEPAAELPIEKAPASEDIETTTPNWLRDLSAEVEEQSPDAEPIAPRPLEDAPDWLSDLRSEPEKAEPAIEKQAEESWQPSDDLSKLDWLEDLGPAKKEPALEKAAENVWVPEGQAASPASGPTPAPTPAMSPRQTARFMTAQLAPGKLDEARQALNYGKLGDAADHYGYLLRRRVMLDEVIADLTAAVHRHPQEVTLWQTLGDAYMRNNQLREALDCYTKAEDLL